MGMAQRLQQSGESRPDGGETRPARADAPRLIDGVIIRKVEQAGRISFVLSDENPNRASYFGLNPMACSIVRLLDGTRGIEDIRRIVNDSHRVDCTREQIESLFQALRENGLLAGSLSAAQLAAPRVVRRGVFQALAWVVQIWFSFRADRLLKRLDPLSALLGRPACWYGLGVFGILGFVTVVAFRRQDLMAVVGDLRNASRGALAGLLAGAYLMRFAVAFCHELAHGATCRHFGGRGIRIGAGLYYLTPVFVCDTSSAWLIEKKRNRILVSFAGPLCQMVIGACGACLFMLPLPHPFQVAAVILIAIGYGENLLTDFNPLLRYDGYYMLADLLEMPNLRARSFAHLRHLFLGGRPAVSSPRERVVCLVYGLLAFSYTTLVLFGIFAVLVSLIRSGALIASLPSLLVSLFAVLMLIAQRSSRRASQG